MKRVAIALPLGWEFELIIGCFTDKKPKDIPYGVATTNIRLNSKPSPVTIDKIDFFNATFDAESLLKIVSVTSITTSEVGGNFCLVKLNTVVCYPENKAVGFNYWDFNGFSYENFIKKLLKVGYRRTSFRQIGDRKCQLRPEKKSVECDTQIVFSIDSIEPL